MGDGVNLTVEILKDIRDEMRGVRQELGHVRDEQRGTNLRLLQVVAEQAQTNARLERVEGRLDHLIEVSGQSWRDLERRVTALELRVGNP